MPSPSIEMKPSISAWSRNSALTPLRLPSSSSPTVPTNITSPTVAISLALMDLISDRSAASPRESSPMPGARMTPSFSFTATSVPSGNTVSRCADTTSGGGRPKLVVSAHLDTVFPEGTDVAVKEKGGVILAPGIGDDSRGLAALLSLIKSINANDIATVGDVMFVGTVGEEELGNLRGVKALFRDHADIDGFISIDGLGITRVVNQATGSHRYEMIFRGHGGHSCQEFGLPSAIHAMGRAIAKISDLQTPSEPKTTFRVGTVGGGTSVNAIAGEARMAVDMRSDSTEELLKLEARLLDLVKQAVVEENARWKTDKISVEIKLIGDPPARIVALDSPILPATQHTATVLTRAPRVTFAGSSTDSNLAMSLGIPAVTIGGGGDGGNWHSRNAWDKPGDAYFGPQNALLTIVMLTWLC